MTGLQGYDLDIKKVHTIKGHGVVEVVNAQVEEEELAS